MVRCCPIKSCNVFRARAIRGKDSGLYLYSIPTWAIRAVSQWRDWRSGECSPTSHSQLHLLLAPFHSWSSTFSPVSSNRIPMKRMRSRENPPIDSLTPRKCQGFSRKTSCIQIHVIGQFKSVHKWNYVQWSAKGFFQVGRFRFRFVQLTSRICIAKPNSSLVWNRILETSNCH